MGLFEKIFGNRPKEKILNEQQFKMLTTYQPKFYNWTGSIYENELIRSAIDARARHISKLKIEIHGSAKPSLKAKLLKAPNEWQTWSQFFYRASTILDMHNNCFIVPVVDNYGETTGYFTVLPTSCDIVEWPKESGKLWLRYRFHDGKVGAVEFDRCAILTKYQYKNDIFGESNRALDKTMDLINIQNQGIEEAVKNSATYRFMARLNNFTKAEDLAKERKEFNENNFADEGGGLLLFPNTYADIKQIQTTPYVVDDAQMQAIKTNVYNYFSVNDKVMQGSAVGDDLDAFFNSVVEPFAIQFSEAMTKAMYTLTERGHGNELWASANRLQYMTTTAKIQMAQQLGDRGVMTINEIRELFNYPPIENGDVATIRGEYKPVTELVEGGNTDGQNDQEN